MADENRSTLRRIRMPENRSGVTSKIEVGSLDLYITVNFYENDQPGEVFIKVAKVGSLISGVTDTICIQSSMLLQVGVPATQVFAKMRGLQFEPRCEAYQSIVDAIAVGALSIISDRGGNPDLDYQLQTVNWSGT